MFKADVANYPFKPFKSFQYCTQRTTNFNEGNFLVYFQDKLNKKFNTKCLNELNRISAIANYI